MASPAIFRLLEKYPQLKPFIQEGRFLTGYTNGSVQGKQVEVFLLRSPWTQFCIQAQAYDVLIPGPVLVITDDIQWSLESKWKAYSLGINTPSPKHSQKNLQHKRQGVSSRQNKASSPLTVLAAEIATEEAIKSSKPELQTY
ncbi:MAG TPA: hypothetical protein DCF68_06695 [Cyanothece sp. UBA12306]|nr:hypothetical protein [Cyanothece sp. UBA12306]